jgi:hypothetical protein
MGAPPEQKTPGASQGVKQESSAALAAADVFSRWGIPTDDRDADTVHSLSVVWADWTPSQRRQLLIVIEAIVVAEAAKRAWNPAAARGRYVTLAHIGEHTARLMKAISGIVPSPFESRRSRIAILLRRLAEFFDSVYEVSVRRHKGEAWLIAQEHIGLFGEAYPGALNQVPRTLLKSLVVLASKRQAIIDDRTFRRYFSPTSNAVAPTPATKYWSANWPLLKEALRLVPNKRSGVYRDALMKYLNLESVPPAGRRGPRSRKIERDENRLSDAKSLRAALTRELQRAKAASETAYGTAIRSALSQHLPKFPREELRELAAQFLKDMNRPSAIATRIAARTYELPLAKVRSGRVLTPLPARPKRGHTASIGHWSALEHELERKATGRTGRKTSEMKPPTGPFRSRSSRSHRRR